MKVYVVVIASAFVLGGLVGGELMDNKFSFEGAVIGGLAIIIGIISLSAYSHAQEEKRKKPALPPEKPQTGKKR